MKRVFAFVAAFLVTVRGQNVLNSNDVPGQCQSQCQNVINQAQNCQNQINNGNNNNNNNNNNDGNNSQYRNCFCASQNMQYDLPNCSQCVQSYQNGNNNNNNNGNNNFNNGNTDVQSWVQTCGFQNVNPSSTYGTYPYGTTTPYPGGTGCSTNYYTTTLNGGNFNNNNGGYYTTTTSQVYCGNGGYYGSQTSWSTTTYTSVFPNNNGNLETSTYTSLVGTGLNGQTTTVPTNYQTSVQPFRGAAATEAALPYAGAGAAFMVAGFFL